MIGEVIDQMRIHSLLQWQCNEWKVGVNLVTQTAKSRPPLHAATGILRLVSSRWHWAASVALLLGGLLLWHQLHFGGNGLLVVAEIVDQQLVAWSDETTASVR